ncbi:MAG: hypothetical protein ACRDOU_27960 [Streptosporangiaceae bacterium]
MKPGDYIELFIPLMTAIVLSVWLVARHLSASREAQAELTTGRQYRDLIDEYRRLSDMAITAQEHADLRLTDISVRLDDLRDQVGKMQHILKEVE